MSRTCQKVLNEKDSVTSNLNVDRGSEFYSTGILPLSGRSKARKLAKNNFLELQKLEREKLLQQHEVRIEVLIANQRIKYTQEFHQLIMRQVEQLYSFEKKQLLQEIQDLKKYKEEKLKFSSMPAPKRLKTDITETLTTNDVDKGLAAQILSCNQVSSSQQQTNVDNSI